MNDRFFRVTKSDCCKNRLRFAAGAFPTEKTSRCVSRSEALAIAREIVRKAHRLPDARKR